MYSKPTFQDSNGWEFLELKVLLIQILLNLSKKKQINHLLLSLMTIKIYAQKTFNHTEAGDSTSQVFPYTRGTNSPAAQASSPTKRSSLTRKTA